MFKKISGFIKSLRFRIFISDVLICSAVAVLICVAAYFGVLENSVGTRIERAGGYIGELALKLNRNVYLSNSQDNAELTTEIFNAAGMYDGRIVVIDPAFRCITDTYNILTDRFIVSEEVIRAVRGNKSEYRNKTRKTAEISVPVLYTGDEGTVSNGCMLFYFSLADDYDNAAKLKNNLLTLLIPGMVLVMIFAIIHSIVLSRPMNRMTKSLKHISEGYVEDQVVTEGCTELKNMADSVNQMLGRLAALENSRQEFVSNVSHELKTPITSMKVLADSLIADPDTPAEIYREFMTDINGEIDRENQIINDLLALVKLDRKNGDMHIAEVSVNEMLELLLKRIKPIAQKNDVELILESYRKVLAEVDEVKLALALSNLIENGVKYNREGGYVKVALDCDHKYFTITVSDNGIGIPESSLELIFDRFYRVDKTRARQSGGTGLGLSIAKSVVLMHHGTLHVDSVEGEGTTFEVKLPLNYVNDAE